MFLTALIIDLDGTLIDSNALHIRAWVEAFGEYGYTVAADRIAVEVGKGGDQLVPSILGNKAFQRDGEKLGEAQPVEFEKLARREGINLISGATQLLDECKRRGIKTALATSSGREHLKLVRELTGIDFARRVDAVVTADDAQKSKPQPDLVLAAARAIGVHPAECAMIGDTPFDAQAAKFAGVVTIGLRCGGDEDKRLREAGCRVIYDDPSDLLANLDDALRICSPSRLRLTQEKLVELMQSALSAAERAFEAGDCPIGAALFDGDGKLVAGGHNEMASSGNKIAHAEIVTFNRSTGKVDLADRDLILVSTLEPCVMCTAAAMESAVDTIIFGLRAPDDAGTSRVNPPLSPESQMPRIIPDIAADPSRALLQRWLDQNQSNPQAEYVRKLLKKV